MTQFAQSLKTWRQARRYSQLELAHEADVSARHLSFLETGRANPSREMIAKLGDALNIPLTARNQLLAHAGFAARYQQRSWDAEEMAPIREAVEYTLDQHAPYPAFIVDRHWVILKTNKPAATLFGMMGVREGESLIEVMQKEEVQSTIENWPEVAHHVAHRLRTESAARGGIEALESAADVFARAPAPNTERLGPVVPTIYRVGELRLSLFSTIAQFGTPEDLSLDDLKIELFFPSDAETKAMLLGMSAQA
ncbi:MAG: helix-turn-helix transcriptional regulator [Henriciella sp.]|nr:helix-turn-helix transcriptional regulator [Henriciella sp.]